MEKKRGHFTGSIGFVLAAAGSAVGLGNIWRFPYLAAKDGGGLFLLVYLILALTFGFALLTTEIAIGRKTKQSPLTAYKYLSKKWGFLGIFSCLVPMIIMPYYCVIGGWVVKYFIAFLTGQAEAAAADGYFTGFITQNVSPIVFMVIFLLMAALVVYLGVDKGIEKCSRVLMPLLLVMIIGISLFALTVSHTDESGVTRTGLDGLAIYVIPDFTGLTIGKLLQVIMDALGQLFFSLSVAMGIMIAYGSYVKDDTDLGKSINRIEFFDTLVAFLAGLMIVPAVYIFMGREGMSAGPSLMFVTLPKIFAAMGGMGIVIGIIFFLVVLFAAVTSAVSILEAIVSSFMDHFHISRKKSCILNTLISLALAVVVCLGYNVLYFELELPNGSVAQILDVMDYISNSILMPLVAFATCILVGWVLTPKAIIEEVEKGGCRFGRKGLYVLMIRFVAPIMLFILLLQSSGILG
ncbi:MAG TPA: sodium-dependent transporter [Lachnospiraceae bacterium]|nr:sodium-dependent transporter [Lachnospiraceae bacterium]